MSGTLNEAAVLLAGALIVVGGALAVAVVWNLMGRRGGGGGLTYRRLCRGLGLDGSQRRLVAQVARAAGIDQASSLLISRGCFDCAVRRCVAGRTDRRLVDIRRLVFGEEGTKGLRAPTEATKPPRRAGEGNGAPRSPRQPP